MCAASTSRKGAAREPQRLSLDAFLKGIGKRGFDEPLIIEYEPRFEAVEDSYHLIRRHGYGENDTQYLKSASLRARDLVQGGRALESALDAQSLAGADTGSWLSWPGMVSELHRDWNLRSVLNFLFCGRKVWHAVECNHIMPHHANLVFSDTSDIIRRIDAGKYGYRIEQRANECVYLPGGFYHRVVTESFAVGYAMWWTWRARLFQQRSITDTWWLKLMRQQRLLQPEQVATVQTAYQARPAFDRLYIRYVYQKYLRICNRLNAQRLEQYFAQSRADADRMKSLMGCASLEEVRRAADEPP
jgi:hypothetical protein